MARALPARTLRISSPPAIPPLRFVVCATSVRCAFYVYLYLYIIIIIIYNYISAPLRRLHASAQHGMPRA